MSAFVLFVSLMLYKDHGQWLLLLMSVWTAFCKSTVFYNNIIS